MNELAITFDVEWAPDWIVGSLAEVLSAKRVSATWFATHASPLLTDIGSDSLFEVGLHPNFLPNSTQGENSIQVMTAMLEWFPHAKSVRTHSLFQSERLLQSFAQDYGMAIDCSILLPRCDAVVPHTIAWPDVEETLIRVPHVFQDNVHMAFKRNWTLTDTMPAGQGLKVFDFHPLHILLNSRDMTSFRQLAHQKRFEDIQPSDLDGLINKDTGSRDLFDELVNALAGQTSNTVTDIVARWQPDVGGFLGKEAI